MTGHCHGQERRGKRFSPKSARWNFECYSGEKLSERSGCEHKALT